MRVAIVDDHPIIRHGIRRLLECESGHHDRRRSLEFLVKLVTFLLRTKPMLWCSIFRWRVSAGLKL